jgi:GNAT superfamily N-acetyltransferase
MLAIEMAVQLRAALAGDRSALRAFLERLSPTTVQLRYLRPAGKLADTVADLELNRILDARPSDHVVVLAVDGEDVRGVGEFIREQPNQAELALVVEDDFQGHGIGRALFCRLEQLAHDRGIVAFTGDIAHNNQRIIRFLRGTGRALRTYFGYGSLRFDLELDLAQPCGCEAS